jgi:hypothetical protein
MKKTIITLLVILFALIFYVIGESFFTFITYDIIKNIHNSHTSKKEKIEPNKQTACLEISQETKTLKNTCKKYSFSFPSASNEIYIGTEVGIDFFCQDNEKDILCMRPFSKKLFNYYDKLKEELEREKSLEIEPWNPFYKNNNINCFNVKTDNNSNSACLQKIDVDTEVVWVFISSNKNSPNIEKMMNSYKTW